MRAAQGAVRQHFPDASRARAKAIRVTTSRHTDARRSIERLAAAGVIRKPPTAYTDGINNLGLPVAREHDVFAGEQGKRDSIVVVAQLSRRPLGNFCRHRARARGAALDVWERGWGPAPETTDTAAANNS